MSLSAADDADDGVKVSSWIWVTRLWTGLGCGKRPWLSRLPKGILPCSATSNNPICRHRGLPKWLFCANGWAGGQHRRVSQYSAFSQRKATGPGTFGDSRSVGSAVA